jgi:hypothetical protein
MFFLDRNFRKLSAEIKIEYNSRITTVQAMEHIIIYNNADIIKIW